MRRGTSARTGPSVGSSQEMEVPAKSGVVGGVVTPIPTRARGSPGRWHSVTDDESAASAGIAIEGSHRPLLASVKHTHHDV
eukprot:2391878-Pyramimonas_sp.AAC.1